VKLNVMTDRAGGILARAKPRPLSASAFSPDGKRLCNLEQATPRPPWECPFRSIHAIPIWRATAKACGVYFSFSPDGKNLGVNDYGFDARFHCGTRRPVKEKATFHSPEQISRTWAIASTANAGLGYNPFWTE